MRKEFAPVLNLALEEALTYLRHVDEKPVGATASLADLRARVCKSWNIEPTAATEVIRDLVGDIAGGLNNSVNARFYAWVIGGALPSALAADWLTSTWDQNAGMYAVAPAAAIVEEAVGAWLIDLFGLPERTSFALVTGCQMAHTTCLAAARSWLLKRQGWDVERQGLAGSPPIRVLCGSRHATIDRALRLLGIGDASLDVVATNSSGALDPAALEKALRGMANSPALVLLQAGDVNTGGFDNFEELLPMVREHGAWAHVDGAFGMWAAASPRYEYLLNGVELAHSWATDGHKWLNVPYDCGYAFVAEPEAHRTSMSTQASYLSHQSEARDPLDWNPEFSRRARGFASYAALRELGRNGVRELVERTCDCAKQIVAGLGQLRSVEVLSAPIINQGLVAFLDPEGRPSDEWNDRMIAAIAREGTSFFSGTTWNGRRAMRISVSNWQTSPEDVKRTIEGVARAIQKCYEPEAAIK
ncbi:MAG: aspartate aminotransferase family protein [Acidobacteriales bacterium]|nr:aspartate aminotransferase family protein [Terriglobales bacterium]